MVGRSWHLGLILGCGAGWAAAHPLCYVNDKPTDLNQVLTFCPAAQDGACCTDLEEAEIKTAFDALNLTGDCADIYKQVACGKCHSYSGHLYQRLGPTLGTWDGLTMKSDFCEEVVEKCDGQFGLSDLDYADGKDYCETHVGGNTDQFWSFPYTEPEIFEPGLNKVFPDLDIEDDFPAKTISMHQSPDGSMYWLMGQLGTIKKVDVDNLASISEVVDISGGDFYEAYEEGLLDFAFSPLFGENGFFYLSYTCELDDGEKPRNRLARFTYVPGSTTSTRDSELILLTSSPKYSSIHSGGWVGFKPSDYGKNQAFHDIYWSTGDGGPQTDPLGSGQDGSNLLGAMIRISVPSTDSSTPYNIPSGNIDGNGVMEEICATGFRNPFRCGFDRETDELYCGDVGHTNVEEVDLVECGKNYGWSRFEGSRCQEATEDNYGDCQGATRSGFNFPLFEYCHPDYDSTVSSENALTDNNDICGDRRITGHAIIGGYVYRGQYFEDLLTGAYIFGDSTNRNIYFIKEEDGEWQAGKIVSDRSVAIISFVEDNSGELMLITRDYNIYHLPCGDLCASSCLDQAELVPSFTSEGCFADLSSDRALSIKGPTCAEGQDAMSAKICASYCATKDAFYFGVQFEDECFCGPASDDFDKHGELPIESCDMLCKANPDEFCGGKNALEVFKLGDHVPSPVPPSPLTPPPVPTPTGPVPTPTGPVPTPPGTPVPTPSESPSEYIGCYIDTNNARIMVIAATQSDMTSEVCSGICTGSAYYGTQNANECWCGDASTDYDQHGETSCTSPCAGDPSEICGGRFKMSVYTYEDVSQPPITPAPITIPTPAPITIPTPAPTPTSVPPTTGGFIGCFVDVGQERIMTKGATEDDMTAEVCSGVCAGSAYYGTQFSDECWCGDASTDYAQHGETTCTYPCAGDPSEICGGRNAMSVYKYEDGPTPTPAPPSPTPEPPSPTPTSGFIGCYADSQSGRIMVLEATQDDMTAEVCEAICTGSAYYGTQFSDECFCGDGSTDYDQYGEADCGMPCAGDENEVCGDRSVMSVYRYGFESPTPTPGSTYLGCYADVKSDRIMSKEASESNMTAEVCEGLCAGSSYFGTQYGKECWCGGPSTDYDQHGTAVCNSSCTGDSSETCGGANAMSVYEY